MGVMHFIFTGQLSFFRFHCTRVEGGVGRYCTILGTRLSKTVCSSRTDGVKGGREVFYSSDTKKYCRKRVTAVGVLDSGFLPPKRSQILMKNQFERSATERHLSVRPMGGG